MILLTYSYRVATLSIQILFIHSRLENNLQNQFEIIDQTFLRKID